MRALILDGSERDDDVTARIAAACAGLLSARGMDVETFAARKKPLRPCLSCSSCGFQTPGRCAQKDAGNEIVRATARCRAWVLVTPIVFGGYGPLLKRALERTMPNIHPYFVMYRGELHHRLRYPRRPSMTFVGWQADHDPEGEAIFARLCARNATNFQVPHRVGVVTGAPDARSLEEGLASLFPELEPVRP